MAANVSLKKYPMMWLAEILIKLNGIVASAINEVKSLILGFTEPTICTTESNAFP